MLLHCSRLTASRRRQGQLFARVKTAEAQIIKNTADKSLDS